MKVKKMIIGNNDAIPDKIKKLVLDVSDHNPHLLGAFLDRKQSRVYREVIMFVSTINSVHSHVSEILAFNISSLCANGYDEVMWMNSCGENSLHRLCQLVRFRANDPIHTQELILLVQKLLIVASNTEASRAMNNWNEMPLHLFLSHCGFDADENLPYNLQLESRTFRMDFLNELLISFPQSIHRSNYEMSLPLHEACKLSQLGITSFPYKDIPAIKLMEDDRSHRNSSHLAIISILVRSYPDALFLKDIQGKSALHHAIESLNCSSEVVLFLWEQMMMLSKDTTDFLDEIKSEVKVNLHRLLDVCLIRRETTLCTLLSALWPKENFNYVRLWRKICMIMSLLYQGTITSSFEYAVHACIFSDAPSPILKTISMMHQSYTTLAPDGETPLTLLLNRKSDLYEFVVNSATILLEAYPHLAQIPNSEQRLPLHIILDKGCGWSDITKDIFLSYKGAAAIQDPVTHLWPFMIAAARSDGNSKSGTETITGIFCLLRASPSVLLSLY